MSATVVFERAFIDHCQDMLDPKVLYSVRRGLIKAAGLEQMLRTDVARAPPQWVMADLVKRSRIVRE